MNPNPKDTVALEDQAQLLDQSGPAAFDAPDGYGDPKTIKPQGFVAFEDEFQVLSLGGPEDAGLPDHLGSGNPFNPKPLAFEDQVLCFLSGSPEYGTTSQDQDLHNHFTYNKPYAAFYYDCTNDPWNSPTVGGFSGYARNGYRYTGGVQDPGPISAPWRTEASGANRSSRPDFPVKSLLVITERELVIFDLDTFIGTPSTLRVWMRFLLGNDASNFYALGRGSWSLQSVAMSNGVLIVGSVTNSWEAGGLFTIDFKALGQNVFSLIRGDGHWQAITAKTISDRNTNNLYTQTGVSPSLRINPEDVWDLSHRLIGSTLYVAAAGEDVSPSVVKYTGNVGQWVYHAVGDDQGADNVGNYRHLLFDDVGWL